MTRLTRTEIVDLLVWGDTLMADVPQDDYQVKKWKKIERKLFKMRDEVEK